MGPTSTAPAAIELTSLTAARDLLGTPEPNPGRDGALRRPTSLIARRFQRTPQRGFPTQSTVIRGPIWDGFWMMSALWLAPIVLWLANGWADPESSPLD